MLGRPCQGGSPAEARRGSTGGPPVQFVIKTTADYRTLYSVLEKLETAARQSGMFIFVDSDLKFDNPQLKISIDRAKSNEIGITMQDIGIALSTMYGGNYTNRFSMLGRSHGFNKSCGRAGFGV